VPVLFVHGNVASSRFFEETLAGQGWLKLCGLLRTPPRRTSQTTFLLENARSQRAPLSLPSLCRSTPIATTGELPFGVRLHTESGMEIEIAGKQRVTSEKAQAG
jgi:hypothetical protein